MRFVSVRELRGEIGCYLEGTRAGARDGNHFQWQANRLAFSDIGSIAGRIARHPAQPPRRPSCCQRCADKRPQRRGTDQLSAACYRGRGQGLCAKGLLLLMGSEPEEFEHEARFLLALKLFELRRISAGKAAEMSEMEKPEFLLKASQLNVAVVDLDQDQLEAEFKNA